MMAEGLQLQREHWLAMEAEAKRLAPEEACGLLAGKGRQVEAVIPVTNVEHSPMRFRMEPGEQVRALLWIEDHGLELVGIYHSHPDGPGEPSPTDLAEYAYPGVVYVIWFREQGEWRGRAFEIQAERVKEIGLQLQTGA
jgi:proteasome lid subunit RPN8/RPN11